MVTLLLALCAPLQTPYEGSCLPVPPADVQRCLEGEHAPTCDAVIARLGASAPESLLRRACAFEAPRSCGKLARRHAGRGDQPACRRSAQAPAGACQPLPPPDAPPGLRPRTANVGSNLRDTCTAARDRQRAAAREAWIRLANACPTPRAWLVLDVATSGDVFRMSGPAESSPAARCIRGHLGDLVFPPAPAPTRLRGRVALRSGRPWPHVSARAYSAQ